MYCLHLWDAKLAADGLDGSLDKIEIPLALAKVFFSLAPNAFPILSGLCLDDYDLFSGKQLENLVDELSQFIDVVDLGSAELQTARTMLKIIAKAQSAKKWVLFDPFRKI